jgi:PIN domain nuclease of toxin-antitoxin system
MKPLPISLRVREPAMFEDPSNTPLFSQAAVWELVIKQGLNREEFNVQPSLSRRALLESGWQERPISANHVLAVAEGLLLITADRQLASYPGPICWMVPLPPSTNP